MLIMDQFMDPQTSGTTRGAEVPGRGSLPHVVLRGTNTDSKESRVKRDIKHEPLVKCSYSQLWILDVSLEGLQGGNCDQSSRCC